MYNACTRPCLICEACNISTWTWFFLQWIWGTPSTNTLYYVKEIWLLYDTQLCWIVPLLHSPGWRKTEGFDVERVQHLVSVVSATVATAMISSQIGAKAGTVKDQFPFSRSLLTVQWELLGWTAVSCNKLSTLPASSQANQREVEFPSAILFLIYNLASSLFEKRNFLVPDP